MLARLRESLCARLQISILEEFRDLFGRDLACPCDGLRIESLEQRAYFTLRRSIANDRQVPEGVIGHEIKRCGESREALELVAVTHHRHGHQPLLRRALRFIGEW